MSRSLVVIGIAAVLAVSGGIGVATTSEPAPAPADVSTTRVIPDSGQDVGAAITALQATLRRLPADHVSWANLAFAYVEQARTTGVPSYYEKADDAAARSLELQPDDNDSGLAAEAAIASARHEFGDALDLADRSLAINPHDLSALAIRVDALTELGRYDDQLAALRTADRRRPSTSVAARYSYAFELRGRLGRAASVLDRTSRTGSLSDRAYVLTLLADIRRRQGRLADAGVALRTALAAAPAYLPAQASLARLQVARGDLDRAVHTWRSVVAQQPLPEYLTELGELYLRLGRPARAQRQFDVIRATVRLLDANGVVTDLETALYEADHGSPRRAVRMARAEWHRRRSIHVADALAWALHQDGRDREALVLARRATALDTPEARLWIHRGTIEAALGRTERGLAHLRRGLGSDPGLSPWQRARARAAVLSIGDPR